MGLSDDIQTLTVRFYTGNKQAGAELALALAEMIGRKGSKRLVWSYFDDLAEVLQKLDRYGELITAADGIDPAKLGVWDCQAAVASWAEAAGSTEEEA